MFKVQWTCFCQTLFGAVYPSGCFVVCFVLTSLWLCVSYMLTVVCAPLTLCLSVLLHLSRPQLCLLVHHIHCFTFSSLAAQLSLHFLIISSCLLWFFCSIDCIEIHNLSLHFWSSKFSAIAFPACHPIILFLFKGLRLKILSCLVVIMTFFGNMSSVFCWSMMFSARQKPTWTRIVACFKPIAATD